MTLQTTFCKIATASVTGALATALALGASGTAVAYDEVTTSAPAGDMDAPTAADTQLPNLSGQLSATASADSEHRSLYRGQVISRVGLRVRSEPYTTAPVVGTLPSGALVWIECKVNSENVDGNPRWYRLAKNLWVWSAARYIANIGPAPRFCDSYEQGNQQGNERGDERDNGRGDERGDQGGNGRDNGRDNGRGDERGDQGGNGRDNGRDNNSSSHNNGSQGENGSRDDEGGRHNGNSSGGRENDSDNGRNNSGSYNRVSSLTGN